MADNLGVNPIPFSSSAEGIDFPTRAKMMVEEVVKNSYNTEVVAPAMVYVVWFCFTLGGWKALCSTSIADGRYYEVTFNKDTQETYVDIYVKMKQEVFAHV